MPYPQGPMTERSPEEDDRRRRDFHPQSPTHSHPVNGTHPPSPFQQFASRPSTSAAMSLPAAMSPRLGPPPSPKTNCPLPNGSVYPHRESSGSTRYDPISEHREGQSNWVQSQYHTRSPKEVCHSNVCKLVLLDCCGSSISTNLYCLTDSRLRHLCQSVLGAQQFAGYIPVADQAAFLSAFTHLPHTPRTPC